MTASNPLHTEPAESATFATPSADRVGVTPFGIATPPAPTSPDSGVATDPATTEPETPQWVELAAGRALQDGGTATAVTDVMVRPIEVEAFAHDEAHELREAAEFDAEARAVAAVAPPGRLYRSIYSVVLTVVVGFFVSGTALAVYVLVRH